MSARDRGPRDAGPDAIPAFFRLVAAVLLAGAVVGLARGLLLANAHHYLAFDLTRNAILAVTSEVSRALAWSATAALIVGVPALLIAFLLQRSFGGIAAVLALLPIHDLVARATAADPARLTTPFRAILGQLPPTIAYMSAALVVSLAVVLAAAGPIRAFCSGRRPSTALLVTVSLGCIVLSGMVRAVASRAAVHRGPNVVLITIDTLRADHLSGYGYRRPTSPRIDAMAARGITFEKAFTPAPRTTQAIAAMMTSLYPQTCNVRTLWNALAPEHVTLSERFRDAGYLTAGFWTTTFLDEKRGLAQGFAVYENTATVSDRANHVTDRAILWLAERVGPRPDRGKSDKRRPFFLWLHYRDPHMPYSPPPEERVFVDPGYAGELRDAVRYYPTKELMVYNHLGLLDSTDVAHATALYDGEILYADRQIGRLLDDLDTRGLTENTIVVLTADHGESLSENGYYFDHGDHLFDSSIHVPLIVVGPKVPAGRTREQVSLLDVSPTIAALAGIPWTGDREGRDLTPVLSLVRRAGSTAVADTTGAPFEGETALASQPFFSESGENLLGPFNPFRYVQGIEGKWRSLRTDRWKLVMMPLPGQERRIVLYDLAQDPAESLDVALVESATAQTLVEKLDAFLRAGHGEGAGEDAGPDAETREKLDAMGYMRGRDGGH
jgi:arylsulfatase